MFFILNLEFLENQNKGIILKLFDKTRLVGPIMIGM